MRTVRVMLHLILLMCLASISVRAQGNIPKEVSRTYPADRYIIRAGTGESPEQASEAARLEIAKLFEAKISGETLVRDWAEIRQSRGKTMESQLTEISNTVMVSASRDIPGIEIAQTNHNKRAKTYEAWAVLEKSRYATILRERIQGIDGRVDDRLSQLPESDLACMSIFSGVMRDLIRREQSRQDLFLLDSASAIVPRDRLRYAVMTSLDSLVAEEFDVGIVFSGEVEESIQSGTISGIVNAGIRLTEYPDETSSAGAGSDLVMIVEHTASPKTTKFRDREFHNIDWVLSVKAAVPATGEVIDALVLNDKLAGAQNETQAKDRMVKKILQAQVPGITSWVYQVIFKPEE